MDRKQLEAYQNNKRLVEWNRKKITEEQQKEMPVIRGTVKGSSPDFPYVEQRFSVEMEEPKAADKSARRILCLQKEIQRAEQEMEEVETFIGKIPDVGVKEIFTYRYLDGMTTREVGEKVGYSHGRISQILSIYIKD